MGFRSLPEKPMRLGRNNSSLLAASSLSQRHSASGGIVVAAARVSHFDGRFDYSFKPLPQPQIGHSHDQQAQADNRIHVKKCQVDAGQIRGSNQPVFI
jgi:hypothetical protein